jgi:hypothetical protein
MNGDLGMVQDLRKSISLRRMGKAKRAHYPRSGLDQGNEHRRCCPIEAGR